MKNTPQKKYMDRVLMIPIVILLGALVSCNNESAEPITRGQSQADSNPQDLQWHLEDHPDWAGAWSKAGTISTNIQWPGWEDAPLTEEA